MARKPARKPPPPRPQGTSILYVPDAVEETTLPLGSIVEADWNPKKPISGRYKDGLQASHEEFNIRDRLKVWPDPKGAFYWAIDGNQRFNLYVEIREKELTDEWLDAKAAELGLADIPDPGVHLGGKTPDQLDEEALKTFRKAQEGYDGEVRRIRSAARAALDEDPAVLAGIKAEALATHVPVAIQHDLDELSAKSFTAAFNRNHAVYDEEKQVRLFDEINGRLGPIREAQKKRLEAMLRPDRAFVPPPANFAPVAAQPQPPAYDPESQTSAEEPWGPPPPDAPDPTPSAMPVKAPDPLMPLLFSVTRESYQKLQDGILKTKVRVMKEARLEQALTQLHAADPDVDLDEPVVELALRILNDRLKILKADAAAADLEAAELARDSE